MEIQPNRFTFQKSAISNLRTPSKKRATYYDEKVQGLCLLVQTSGHRAFGWYRSVDGRPRFLNVGVFPDLTVEQARAKATEYNAILAKWKADDFQGVDPFGPTRATKSLTVRDLFDAYCDSHLAVNAKNPDKAVKSAKWVFDTYLAALRDVKPRAIRRGQVLTLHETLVRDVGLFTANRALQLLKAVYNHALDHETFEGDNPCTRVKLPKEPKRKRSLQADELPRFFKALTREKNVDLRDFILLALFTGARRGDVLSMTWKDIALKAKAPAWVIPNPKSETPYTVELAPEAVDVLKRRAATSKSEWVFPNPNTENGHLLDMKKGWKRFLTRAKIENFRVHDLRHTHATWQANGGSSLQIIGKSLGHASTASTEIYSQPDAAPIRQSVGNAIATILTKGKMTRAKLASLRAKPRRATDPEQENPVAISQ